MTPSEKRANGAKLNALLSKADFKTVLLVFFALSNKTRMIF